MKYRNLIIFILVEAIPYLIKQTYRHDDAIEPYYTSQDIAKRSPNDTD